MAAFLAAAKALKKNQTTIVREDTQTDSINCPFDLDDIFRSDTERFGKLQEVLKYIFDQLNMTSTKIEGLDMKLVSKFMEIS